jgi:hypothetical protein
MALYDFRCNEGHVFEKRTSMATIYVPCEEPDCTLIAKRDEVNRLHQLKAGDHANACSVRFNFNYLSD